VSCNLSVPSLMSCSMATLRTLMRGRPWPHDHILRKDDLGGMEGLSAFPALSEAPCA